MASKGNGQLGTGLELIECLDKSTFWNDEHGRLQALDKARALCCRLETPWESLTRIIWQEPSVATAIKLASDLRLFAHLPSTPTEFKTSGAEPELIRRLLRLLSSALIVTELKPDVFGPTHFSEALAKPGYIGDLGSMFFDILPFCLAAPQHFAETDYCNPTSPTNTPFTAARGETFYEWLGANQVAGAGFNNLMAEFSKLNTFKWTEVYPISRLTHNIAPTLLEDNAAPLVVDVGGGLGTSMDLLKLVLSSESKQYKLVIQDVASVVSDGQERHPELTFITHDFFTPQLIVGARAYFMRNVLHDWPDEEARLILQNLKAAVGQSAVTGVKSKLLLEENVMFDRPTDMASEAMDFIMMGLMAASERSKTKWRALLNAEGFGILEVWRGVGSARAVIEAELLDHALT